RLKLAQAPELAGEDVWLAVRATEALTGRVDVEDILDRVFSQFCIGK
ncbi:MAG: tRNA uridine-5-carboxymethylaminomethyl(34) synthesis GTPase MnmE, partial [Maricaulis sp.]|nr:tRNA uridine-5-carboxymethylaminomethyl(34) synthesis GTPase MnmE [Maricaulis sp.]